VQLPLDPSEVFASVLNKEAGKAVPSPVRQQRVEAQGNQFNGFLSGLMTMGARGKDGDYDLLKACEKRMPLNEGFSSQLQRSNKEIKKLEEERNTLQMDEELGQKPEVTKKQAKPKGKAKAKAKCKSSGSKGKPKTMSKKPHKPEGE
jgi:hypothetical protein